ncbi:MAG: translation elongation factor Ts [Bacteroidia bacterium]
MVSVQEISRLRQLTGAGIMDCKNALQEAAGDFDRAIEILRKKGHKMAAARQDRQVTEGSVFSALTDGKGAIVLLSCETDFVARNEAFRNFGASLARLALQTDSTENFLNLPWEGKTVHEALIELTARIGEKLEISEVRTLTAPFVTDYIHLGGKIGVLVGLGGIEGLAPGLLEEAGKNVAMQIAALRPIAVSRHRVPADLLAKEKEIAMEQARAEGKPENLLEKIAIGKLEKFYKESVLLEQEYFKEPGKMVQAYLRSFSPTLEVQDFIRLQIGKK